SYDARGRMTQETWPAHNGAAARTVTYGYSYFGYPARSVVSDGATEVTSFVDLLGRVTRYFDANGDPYHGHALETDYSYDQVGRVTSTFGPQGTVTNTYDSNSGRLSGVALDGATLASVFYDETGRPFRVSYSNGNTHADLSYDAVGRVKEESVFKGS